MKRILTVSMEDLNELDRLNKDLASAPKGDACPWLAPLVHFIEEHPTILPYCTLAGREKKRAKIKADSELGTFTSLHAGGRR